MNSTFFAFGSTANKSRGSLLIQGDTYLVVRATIFKVSRLQTLMTSALFRSVQGSLFSFLLLSLLFFSNIYFSFYYFYLIFLFYFLFFIFFFFSPFCLLSPFIFIFFPPVRVRISECLLVSFKNLVIRSQYLVTKARNFG